MVNMTVQYQRPDNLAKTLFSEVAGRFGARAQNKGYVTGYMDSARAGQTGGHFADQNGIAHAVDIGVDIELDGSGLLPVDAMWLAEHLRKLGKEGKHPFSKRGYLIHDMSSTTTPRPLIAGFHTNWEWTPYTGASPHSDHIHVTTGGDVVWGRAAQVPASVYDSTQGWGILPTRNLYRPVPDFIGVSQKFGENPTGALPSDHWLIKRFGNYQPNGHAGIDYNAAEGTDVYAVTDGRVLYAGDSKLLPGLPDAYATNDDWVARWLIAKNFAGNVVVIDHGDFLGIYAHLSKWLVRTGQTIVGGQRIALSGNTGGSTGPHLHFEVLPEPFDYTNGMYGRINPANYLGAEPKAPGWFGYATPSKPEVIKTLMELVEEMTVAEFTEALKEALEDDTVQFLIGRAVSDAMLRPDAKDRLRDIVWNAPMKIEGELAPSKGKMSKPITKLAYKDHEDERQTAIILGAIRAAVAELKIKEEETVSE